MPSDAPDDVPYLHQADPAWVAKLASGMNWLVVGLGLSIALAIASIALSIDLTRQILEQIDTIELEQLDDFIPAWLCTVSALSLAIISIVFLIGCLRFTAEEPGRPIAPSLAMTRWTCVPAFAINIPASLALLVPGGVIIAILSIALKLTVIALLSVGFPASLVYMRYLANRVPAPGLAKQAMIVFWGQFIAGILLIACLVVLLIVVIIATQRDTVADLGLSLLWIMIPALLSILLFFVWWVWLMLCYRSRLARASKLRRTT